MKLVGACASAESTLYQPSVLPQRALALTYSPIALPSISILTW